MNWRKYNWPRAVLALAVTLSVLSVGQILWHNYVLAGPLDKALTEIDGVERVSLLTSRVFADPLVIDVTLKNVANLQKTYGEISEKAANSAGGKGYKIELHDHRTPELENLYYAVHYDVQEAAATGHFSQMEARVQAKALSQGATAKIYVSSEYIYVALYKELDNLYVLIPRGVEVKNNVKH